MKKVIILLLIAVLSLSVIAADKPPKPPKVMSVEIYNKAGEDVRVTFTGLGYDFQNNMYVGGWGVIRPQYASVLVPGTIETVLPNKTILVNRLPLVIKRVDLLRDLYVLDMQYAREITPKGSDAASVMCLNTWVPPAYYGDPTYYPVRYARQRLVIKACNSVPVNLGAPSEGILKYNRLGILLATSGYGWK